MKILVVEDDTTKLRNIVNAITEVEGVFIEDVATVTDANGAKQFLRDRSVDMLVLDLHLPERIDLPPTASGGLDFIRSISTRPSFFVPAHVVAVSGNSDALSSCGDEVGELWGVIRYDASSELWRSQLKARVRYAKAAWHSKFGRPRETRPCDVAIVTALDDELAGILRLPLSWTEFRAEGDNTVYHEGVLTKKDGQVLQVVATTASRMGMAPASALASKVIDLYRPDFIAMPGITGGIRGRVELGDILVADPSWDWGAGKYEVIAGKPRFAASPEQLRLNPDIRSSLIQASQNDDLLSSIRSSFVAKTPPQAPRCHVQAVASGASVLGDEAVVEEIKLQHRKLHGVEMEIFGVMMAAEMCAKPRPVAFSAKAVSDFADTTKDDDHRAYAIHVSANFLMRFLQEYL